jgi:hypothetical protein
MNVETPIGRKAAPIPIRRLLPLAAAFALLLSGRSVLGSPGKGTGEESEPRLIVPGGHAVRTGQLVDLRWSPADSVRELEILLSVDGGRHYSICISPQLDPTRCEFVWRVPDLEARTVRMRIRFNRGGREIEGPPAAPIQVFRGGRDEPEPLALPPAERSEAPRSGSGRSGAPASESAPGSCELREGPARSDRSLSRNGSTPMTLPDLRRPGGPDARRTSLTEPRFVPLRA